MSYRAGHELSTSRELSNGAPVGATTQALLVKQGAPIAVARVRNVSRCGLFVQADCGGVEVAEELEVELLLHNLHPARSQRGRFPARVAAKTAHGLALEVDENNTLGRDALLALMWAEVPTERQMRSA